MKKLFLAAALFVLSCNIAFANTQVVFDTNRGSFVVELFDKEAPLTVANFLSYVDSGFYDGTIFHRVIADFMIQGGGFTKELSKKETRAPIKNEASEKLKNERGTIAMARTSAPDSATSQFFINVVDNDSLNWRKWNVGYAVFGKVVQGLEIVDSISTVPTGNTGMHRDVPVDAVQIIKAYRVKTQK